MAKFVLSFRGLGILFCFIMITIIQWNAQSIKAHGDEFKNGVFKFKYLPDIICVQETWLNKSKNYKLTGYDFIRKDRLTGAHGGCGIFVKKGIAFSTRDIDLLPVETQVIDIWSHDNKQKTTIVNVYNPGVDLNVDALGRLINNNTKVIICGDFNAHNTLWGSDKNDRNGNVIDSFLDTHNLFCLNDGTGTRLDPHTGKTSHIDLSFCSQSIATQSYWFVHDDKWGSDHYPICIRVGIKPYCSVVKYTPSWSLRKADWVKFDKLCDEKINWPNDNDNINDVYNKFMSDLNEVASESIPRTKFISNNKPPISWWNDKCDQAVKNKKKALNVLKRSCLPQHLIDYKRKRAIARRTIREAKKQSWQKFCEGICSQTSTKKVWNKIKKISPKNISNNIPVLNYNGSNAVSDADKTNALAQSFAHVSSNDNYNDDFKETKNRMENNLSLDNSDDNNCLNEPFSLDELDDAIKRAKCTTPGDDGIGAGIIKRFPVFVRQVLLLIFNMIWLQGECPEMWKHAILIPVPKPGKDHRDPLSYRPIALTSVLCKTMERMISKRMLWFLESKKLLNPIQSGFRKGRRTVDHLVRLESAVNKGFAYGASTVAVFLDIQKAYDMVWRKGIVIKMKQMGFGNRVLRWVNNFLSERYIQVKINGILSEKFIVENGLPQGSVISPILFNIGVSDIPEHVPEADTSQYADDVDIWKTHRNIIFALKKIQSSLDKLTAWGRQWGFQWSTPKTVAMIFTNKRIDNLPELKLNNRSIKFQKSTKFLGLFFDSKLCWNKHFQYIIDRCKPRINLLRCIAGSTWGADGPMLLRIYKALIRSILDYGCEAFNSASDSLKVSLDSIQYKALKICTGAIKGTPLASLQVECGDPPLELRRDFLTKCYGIAIRANHEHPGNELFMDNWQKQYFFQDPSNFDQRKSNHRRPFEARVENSDFNIFNSSPPIWPFWDCVRVECSTDIHSLCQGVKDRSIIREVAIREIGSTWSSALHIYTDGSVDKSKSQVGCSIVVPTFKYSRGYRLPGDSSIYSAELTAMLMALEWVDDVKPSFVVIFSDSLSGIQSLPNFDPVNKIICDIQHLYKGIYEQGMRVVFSWVPGHVGIYGNELADSVAKTAAVRTTIDIPIPLQTSEIKTSYKMELKAKWQNLWSSNISSLHDIQPMISTKMSNWGISRKLEVKFHQLRLGKCYFLNSYLFQINKHSDGQCPTCKCKEDTNHFLLECDRYNAERKILFDSLQDLHYGLKQLLGGKSPPIKEVIKYVDQCKFTEGP